MGYGGVPHISPMCWGPAVCYQGGQPHAAACSHHKWDLHHDQDLHHQPWNHASRHALSRQAALQLPAHPSLYLKQQPWVPCRTQRLGHSMCDAAQAVKHSRSNLHGEVLEVLLQVLGCRLSILGSSSVLVVVGASNPGAEQVKVVLPQQELRVPRMSQKHILSCCTSSLGVFNDHVCDEEPDPVTASARWEKTFKIIKSNAACEQSPACCSAASTAALAGVQLP